jgi:hypothetical protein
MKCPKCNTELIISMEDWNSLNAKLLMTQKTVNDIDSNIDQCVVWLRDSEAGISLMLANLSRFSANMQKIKEGNSKLSATITEE